MAITGERDDLLEAFFEGDPELAGLLSGMGARLLSWVDEPAVEVAFLNDVLDSLAGVEREIARAYRVRAGLIGRAVELAARLEALVVDIPTGERDTPERRRGMTRRYVAAEVAGTTRVPRSTARTLVEESIGLSALARVGAALDDGGISYRHAQAILAEIRALPAEATDDEVEAFEEEAVARARRMSAVRLRRELRVVRERVFAQGAQARHDDAMAARRVELVLAEDGMAWLSIHHRADVLGAAYGAVSSYAARAAASEELSGGRCAGLLAADIAANALLAGMGGFPAGAAEDDGVDGVGEAGSTVAHAGGADEAADAVGARPDRAVSPLERAGSAASERRPCVPGPRADGTGRGRAASVLSRGRPATSRGRRGTRDAADAPPGRSASGR